MTMSTPPDGRLDGRTPPLDLPDVGRRIAAQLDAHFDPAQARTRQVLALVEEAGEFADAWTAGDEEEIAAELADVLITAHVTAAVLGFNIGHGLDTDHMSSAAPNRLVLRVTRAACRVAGAYRRAAGMARRSGVLGEVLLPLVEVVGAVYYVAYALRIDLDAAVAAKVDVVFTRGWRDPAASRPQGAVWPGDPDWVDGFGPVPGPGLGDL